jgi:hypothetical protein
MARQSSEAGKGFLFSSPVQVLNYLDLINLCFDDLIIRRPWILFNVVSFTIHFGQLVLDKIHVAVVEEE